MGSNTSPYKWICLRCLMNGLRQMMRHVLQSRYRLHWKGQLNSVQDSRSSTVPMHTSFPTR